MENGDGDTSYVALVEYEDGYENIWRFHKPDSKAAEKEMMAVFGRAYGPDLKYYLQWEGMNK